MQYPVLVEVVHAGRELVEEGFGFGGEERLDEEFEEGFKVVF